MYAYRNTYMHVATIDEKRGYAFEREWGEGLWEGLAGRKGRENVAIKIES